MIKKKIGKSKVRRYFLIHPTFIVTIFIFLLMICFDYPIKAESQLNPNSTSKDLTIKAWDALSKGDFKATFLYADECIRRYKEEAKRQQGSLNAFPRAGEVDNYEALNNVAACLFIKGEALFQQGKYKEAEIYYKEVINNYSFAQYWDPKGWYWKIAEKSQAVLDKIAVMLTQEPKKKKREEVIKVVGLNFPLFDKGKEDIVDYEKYGYFENIGTPDYKYIIKDKKGLAKAVGVGIFPNNSVYRDPVYKSYIERGLLDGSHWDYVNSNDLLASFYKWATAGEDPGVKLFYTAQALESARHYKHAIKAYYAIVVHYPKTISWTYWKTPWYVGQVAIDKINYLTRNYPKLGMKLVGADITIKNGFDFDVTNDVIITNPGRIIKATPQDLKVKFTDLSNLNIVKKIGGPKVELVQYENGHWQLRLDGNPILVKAVAYTPTVVGQSPDKGTLMDWSYEDYNHNGLIDGPFDSWVDKDLNNNREPDEEIVGDFKLLKEMGANAIRVYHHANTKNKQVFRKAYKDYGLMILMGDFLGAYAIGSGANWNEGTDYSNPIHRQNMKKSVREMVEEYKDEPYILMWVLGNENNYGVANNVKKDPVSFYKFVNEVAEMVKQIDPTRPVAICNGDTLFLDIFAKYAPSVDIYGANCYRGKQGFGVGFWKAIKRLCDKPVLVTEYGCPAYQKGRSRMIGEIGQAEYHKGAWEDILYNSAGYEGVGNSIGGVVFEWLDEWWKAYEPYIHDTDALYTGPFPGGWVYEEWFGIVGQGDGSKSPYIRQLRESYFLYKKLWNTRANY